MRNENPKAGGRRYRKGKRAADELQTRERITEAAVALHQSVGPAHTSIKAIASRAGVQRATVYRHFPDEQALFDACTGHYFARHPMPDPQAWSTIAPPAERLARALADLYEWYGQTEEMLFNSFRDAEMVPPATREAFIGYFAAVPAVLMAGRSERGRARTRVSGAIGHAIGFATWRSLVREQALEVTEAIGLMAGMVDAAGARPRRTARPKAPLPPAARADGLEHVAGE